ncbi:regulatory protein RecX [Alkanindiges illinoisensis]|uniref:Regulatory protein RecX n=1 Tax=Alkanindiges illinoisensis TaxID=197183 RepID=A0A4Y7XEX6_9GAMM|nr:regulatory protein RecX [Alkanindiges illinoisensis]TEU30358.1 regulatory protein RecX [Alkanindiges illinoisensis]
MKNFQKNSDLPKPAGSLKGQRLRSTAFALLAKREHSKQELKSKLLLYGASPEELEPLLAELTGNDYQSDERMAGMLVRANMRKGRGPARIQQELKKHHIEAELAEEDIEQVNWLQQAMELRMRKFGEELPTEQKEKVRQVRFLQYRGFNLDICFKAITKNSLDDE